MPNDRASRVGRGITNLWLGDAQSAVDDLSAAIGGTTAPDNVTAWAHRARGLAYARLGQAQDAVADYEQYLALSPGATDRDEVAAWIAALT